VALALLLSAAARAAEPTEPLKVTRLGDPESGLQISAATDNIGVPDGDSGEFGRAVSDAVRAQQQSIQASCQSAPTAKRSIAVRWAWEARCRYRRY
jgi:hypothetical protein